MLTLVMLCTMYAKADSSITLRSGNPQAFLEKSKATFEVVWDNARVTNWDNKLFPQYLKHRGDDFVRDWPKDRQKAEQYFTVRINKKSPGLKIEEDGGSADYKMIIRLDKMDAGNGASGFVPYANAKAGGVVMDGTLELRDRAGKLLCALDISEAKGVGHPSETVRYGMTLFEVANDLIDFMKDVKKGKVEAKALEPDTAPKTRAAKEETAEKQKVTKTVKKVVQQTPKNMYRVSGQKVNVRSAATTKSSIVGSLLHDQQVEVKSISNGWATVDYKGATRYVSASYLEKVPVVEEVVEEVEEEEEEEEVAAPEPISNNREAEEKASKSKKKEKKEKEKKSKARDDKRADNDGGSRFPSFKPDVKYMGEWHIGYATTGHINGYKNYTAHVQTGFLQGVSFNEYLEFGIGLDIMMNTHYRTGGDFGDITWAFAPYAHVRGFFPVKPKVKPYMSFGVGPSWAFLPDFSSKPVLFLEFGPGIRWKQFNLFLGLQKTGKGAGSNHFISKVGWYF